ncbi:MAG: hypothetical protein OEQ18_02120 [Gammaproteobacteria bacterium]|nr:hypothetical protein [Gammaproteobacteria bacterium]
MAEDIVARLVLQGQQYFSTITQANQRTQRFQKDTQQGFKGVTSVIQTATKALVAFGAAAVVRQIARMINDVARVGDELAKMSQRTGLAVEFLNGLTQAAGVADVSQESLAKGIKTLNKNLLDMTQGTGEAKDSFEAMGISAKDAGQLLKTPEDSLIKVLDLLSRIPDVSRRGAVAQELLGKAGTDWLPLINQGTDAIKRQIAEFQKLRPITAEQAKAAEAYNDSITALGFAFEGFLQKGLGPVLPSLTQFVKLMTELVALDFDSLGFRMNTVFQDLGQSLKLAAELIADPLNFEATLKKYEEQDKKFIEERRKRFAGPESLTPPIDTLPVVTVAEKSASAQLGAVIQLRDAQLELLKAEEARDQVSTDRQAALRGEIILLTENLTIQKEIEAAAKGKREVDPTVAQAAAIKAKADLVALAGEEVTRKAALNSLEQEGLGYDIVSTDTQRQNIILLETRQRLAQENLNLEIRALDPLGDVALLRGQEIVVLRTKHELLLKEQEVLGQSVARQQELLVVEAKLNALKKEGQILSEESKGRGIVQGATVDLQRKLEGFRRAARDAQNEVTRGEALPNQLAETQQLRRIDLKKAEIALIKEEQRAGIISFEEANRRFSLADAQLRAETEKSQQTFLGGWQSAFRQFAEDSEGAFGLGQTLARNFVTNLQTIFSSTIVNIFDKLEEGTLTWRSALETLPNLLKQITAQLISMAIVRGITSAIGGAFNANTLGSPSPSGADYFNSIPGNAAGGSFMVGGRGGVDANFIPMRLTRGERVNIETAEQQRRGSGMTVNIYNNAGVDIRQEERQTPNGNVLDVLIDRRVRRVNRSEFGLSQKPGRVG